MNSKVLFVSTAAAALLFCGCQNNGNPKVIIKEVKVPVDSGVARNINLQPNAIPGTPKFANDAPTGAYAPSNVQAQLKIDVRDNTREVKVIRDNSDPFVISKIYLLKHADPYAVRSYLEAAVGARSVSDNPAQVMAIKFADGSGAVMISAEEYRFARNRNGRGLDDIVRSLDRPGLTFAGEAGVYVYFPRISRAANLRDMLLKVGSHELDPQFAVSPSTIVVDGELNALVIKAPEWSWREMRKLLQKYDRPIPEIKVSYRILEIYAENDDRIGVDFQSWKNNEGVDFFSAGTITRRNWGTFFTSGVQDNGWNRTSYWNFNPKWNTRYLDFMTSIGKARCLAQGILVAQNRRSTQMQVNTGFFYDRTYYTAGATSIAEGCTEFTYTDPNPDTILREANTKIMPYEDLLKFYAESGAVPDYKVPYTLPNGQTVEVVARTGTQMAASLFKPMGYTMRVMGTQTGTFTYGDASAVAAATGALPEGYTVNSDLAKYLTGYIKADGTPVRGGYYNTNWDSANSAPGIIHGWLQYPMVTDGFKFNLKVTPIITGKAAKMKFDLDSISLLGWNSDGSARTSSSGTSTTVQIGTDAQEFVIGGLRKSESVRGTAGLPFLKDLPLIGRALSTESESIKQSQLVVIAKVELVQPSEKIGADVQDEIGKIVKLVNKGITSPVGNMFFEQYLLDSDRPERETRLERLNKEVNDNYREPK